MPRRKNNIVRNYYKALIKNLNRVYGPISRTTLRKMTGMKPASITDVTKELLQEGIIRERGHESSKRGRRKVLLDINPDGGRAVAVEFSPSRILGLGIDLKLGVCYKTRRSLPPKAGKEIVIESIKGVFREVFDSPGVKAAPVLGFGVADPGIVDTRGGISVFSTQVKGWENVPLKEIFEKEFPYPFFVERDTRCRLIAEKNLGLARPYNDILMVDLSSGVSSGVMSEGKLFRGSRGAAGELGHMMMVENGPYCNCGSQGCLEALVSSRAVVQRILEAIRSGATSLLEDMAGGNPERIDIHMVAQAVEDGDKLSLRVVEETGRLIGEAIANAVNLYNPEIVVLTGELLSFGDHILQPIEGTVRRQALSYNTADLKIEVAEVGEEGAAWGMAALLLDQVFEIRGLHLEAEE
ncbi:MAG TPA: ROK family transcriptional regulator [Atribacteraceae bacterium]|nr:ROK family transcriptional regulator [Atribacteraceae bacterium]